MTTFEEDHSIDANIEISSISTSEEVEFLHEQVEFLRLQIESMQQLIEHLNLELLDKQQQIDVLEEELVQTNKELCRALTPPQPEIHRGKQLAQEVSVSEALATPLNTVYNYAIPAQKLEVEEAIANTATLPNMVAQQTLNNSQELRTRSQQLNSQFNELGSQFIINKNNFIKSEKKVDRNFSEWQQKFDAEAIVSQVQESKTRAKANVMQFQEHVEQTKKLLNKSKAYVNSVKSRSVIDSSEKILQKSISAKLRSTFVLT